MTKKPDSTKMALLLSAIGPEALEWFNHFIWTEGQNKNKFEDVKTKFESEFASQKRLYSVDVNSGIAWEPQETISINFSLGYKHSPYPEPDNMIRTIAEPDNMIRYKIVFSTEKPALKVRLLHELKLSLEKAVDIPWSSELSHKELVGMKGTNGSNKQEVDAFGTNRVNKPYFSRGGKQPQSWGWGHGSR